MTARDEFVALTRPLPEPHMLVSTRGKTVAANPAARREFGIEPGAAVPPLVKLFQDSPSDVASYLRVCSRSSALLPGTLTFRARNGSGKRYRCSGAIVHPPEDGRAALILLRFHPHEEAIPQFLLLNQRIDRLARTLHERRRAQESLQAHALKLTELTEELERQKAEVQAASHAKSHFLAAMSHELRTPLNGIIGYVDLLDAELKGPLNEEQHGQIERIRRSASHLIAIIAQILDYSRLEVNAEKVNLESVDARSIVRQAAEMIEPAYVATETELVTELPASPAPVETDVVKVRQILLNLLSNAVKFAPGGTVHISLVLEQENVRISVTDNGIGIASDALDHVFEAFWQAERGSGGTGLGLPVTRRLAEILGGELDVESVEGEGSTFTLILPARGT